jgi:hypothetical protein
VAEYEGGRSADIDIDFELGLDLEEVMVSLAIFGFFGLHAGMKR